MPVFKLKGSLEKEAHYLNGCCTLIVLHNQGLQGNNRISQAEASLPRNNAEHHKTTEMCCV